MRRLMSRFRPLFLHAAVFSFLVNVLLLVPALFTLQVFDRVLSSRSNETLALLSVAAVGALVIMIALDVLRGRLLLTAAVAMDKLVAPRVLGGMLGEARSPGGTEYVHGMRDLGALRSFLTGTGILSLFDAPWLPVYLIVIFMFHPVLGAVATFGGAALLLLAWLNERLTRKPLEAMQSEGRKSGRFIDLCLRNAEAVGALGMIESATRTWQGQNRKVLEMQVANTRAAGTMSGLTKFVRQLVQVAMLGAGAYLVIDLHVTAGVMMAATILLGRALAPVESLIAGWRSLVEARSAYRRLEKLLERETDQPAVTSLPAPKGVLCAEKVVFAVSGKDRPILKGVSFEIAAGESLGIIGPSASGKSTLARLIVGVWKPLSGVVRLDGADIAGWPRDRIGPHIGYLPQDVELFAGTVSENIARLGEVDAEAVVEAAIRANAHEMILRLPNGYDTAIGEGGSVLSGGQRQRIALARALYGAPRLVVLDEPNANLDSEGEDALMRAMLRLKQDGVTLLFIAHRPSLLADMDKLLVLRDGAVEMFGPRAEIMARLTRGSVQPSVAVAGSIGGRA
jgi:PrtD family type I secretion system ABC transporter